MGFFSRARPIPFVPQMEATECGAACLTMVLAHFGKHVPLAQVRTACKVSRDGLSALDVAEAAEGYGLEVNAVRIEVDELMQMEGPAILHWRLDHFVVFEKALGDRVRIVDPGSSRLDIPIAQLAEDFSGIAIFLSKGPKLTPSPKENPSLSYYAKALRTALGPVSLVLGTVLMLELVAFVFPAASQIVLDTVIAPKQDQWLVYVGGVLLFATLLRLALSTVRDHLVTGMQIVVDVTLMGRFMTHLLSLPIEFFEQRTSGDLMSRVQGNAAVRTAAVRAAFGIIDGLLVVSYGALMLAYDPKLGVLALAVALLQVAAVFRVRARARELTAGELVATTHEATTFMEAMSSPEATKAFRMERLHISRFTHRSAARLNASLTRRSYIEGRGQLVPILTALGHAVVLWFGGDAVIHDRMTLGVFASFLAIEALLSQPMNELVATFQDLQLVREHLARLDDVWSTRKEARGTIDPGRIRGEIRLENVAFRYNRSGPFVVEGIDVAIRPGEKVAIVGPSGAGKSTIAKLLVGLLVPEQGTVWVDGRDLRTLDLGKFRRRTGIVLQDAYVFDDDVRANLAFGDEHATIDTLRQAAETACILPTLDALPQGFDTRLGANAGRLSGGQRQRLVLARELAKEPHLLLLDEATSSLDLDVERTLHQNLASIRCTRIVIAHRLATVRDADRVLVVDGGRVVQDGTYDSLAREPGIFQRMVATLRT